MTQTSPSREWYPHLDYAGEPMNPGEFRDPDPRPSEQAFMSFLKGFNNIKLIWRHSEDDPEGESQLLCDLLEEIEDYLTEYRGPSGN